MAGLLSFSPKSSEICHLFRMILVAYPRPPDFSSNVVKVFSFSTSVFGGVFPNRGTSSFSGVFFFPFIFVPSLRVQVFGSCSDYLISVLLYFILFFFIMFLFRALALLSGWVVSSISPSFCLFHFCYIFIFVLFVFLLWFCFCFCFCLFRILSSNVFLLLTYVCCACRTQY